MEKETLVSKLTEYFCKENNIDLNVNRTVEKVNARELIIKNRIDLVAKMKYIEHREKKYDLTFIKKLYTAHIEAFSLGTFTEPGNEDKNSINKYFRTFDHLIDHIKMNGVDENISVIPVGRNNTILDGAHRVAIAAYFDLEVPIVRFDDITATFDAVHFKENLLPERYIDYLVSEYCKLKSNIYIACVWPRGSKRKKRTDIEKLIKATGDLIHMKDIKLNYSGLSNLIPQIYSAEHWIGTIENHYLGARNKIDACYSKNEMLTLYIFECDCPEKVLNLKNEIRDLCKVGKHSIHITDTAEEVEQVTKLLLNQNSVDFLNTGKPFYAKRFNKQLNQFKKQILDQGFSIDECIIDSSSTMALYGLKDLQKIGFMALSDKHEAALENFSVIEKPKVSKMSLILNPDYHFIYNDLKFVKVTLDLNKNTFTRILIKIKMMKNSSISQLFDRTFYTMKRMNRSSKLIARRKIVMLLKKIAVYEILKEISKFVNKKGSRV